MPIAKAAYRVSPARVLPPTITLSFRLLRDGIATTGPKTVRVYQDWGTVGRLSMVFRTMDGEHTDSLTFDAATVLGQSEWLVAGLDPQLPKRTRAAYVTFSASGQVEFNIIGVDGGAGGGAPATLNAVLRVDQQPAAREVVVLEKPSDGAWRIAGHGASVAGAAVIDLRVTDGHCYAMALDDWGGGYQPSLEVEVGQTIRPSVFTGWLYRITEAGILPATEPTWWPAEGDNASRLLGTARAIAVRYYQPLAHGPLPVELL